MKIVSSQLNLAARNQSKDITQRLGQAVSRRLPAPTTMVSTETRRSLETSRESAYQTASTLTSLDGTQLEHASAEARQSALRLFTTRSTGVRSGIPTTVGASSSYQRHEIEESTQYHLSGQLSLQDGKHLDFSITGNLSRSLRMEQASGIHAEKLQQKDPLILNFAAGNAQLTEKAFEFDIDADGSKDQVSFATAGSAFLFVDRNGNNTLDDGSELFGTRSGDGFAELAAHDDDRNGFIDSGDNIYAQLKLMSRSEAGADVVTTLAESNIGALGLQSVATEFEITNDYQQSRGRLRATGVAVSEDGAVMTLQQVDLTQRSLRDEATARAAFAAPAAGESAAPANDTESAIAEALQRLQQMTEDMQRSLRENAEPAEKQENKSLLALLVERILTQREENPTAATSDNARSASK